MVHCGSVCISKRTICDCSCWLNLVARSPPSSCSCGVSQGSVLGPILFAVYTSPIVGVADAYQVNQQQYAELMTQLYAAFTKSTATASIYNVETSLVALKAWFVMNTVSPSTPTRQRLSKRQQFGESRTRQLHRPMRQGQ